MRLPHLLNIVTMARRLLSNTGMITVAENKASPGTTPHDDQIVDCNILSGLSDAEVILHHLMLQCAAKQETFLVP